mmetsp:Transcript_131519/g.281156  ORF Transcript_131519/g.281156 Transcript_131519/m.281156 type:complete len:259 (-) Transcript_131519:208-984(-)
MFLRFWRVPTSSIVPAFGNKPRRARNHWRPLCIVRGSSSCSASVGPLHEANRPLGMSQVPGGGGPASQVPGGGPRTAPLRSLSLKRRSASPKVSHGETWVIPVLVLVLAGADPGIDMMAAGGDGRNSEPFSSAGASFSFSSSFCPTASQRPSVMLSKAIRVCGGVLERPPRPSSAMPSIFASSLIASSMKYPLNPTVARSARIFTSAGVGAFISGQMPDSFVQIEDCESKARTVDASEVTDSGGGEFGSSLQLASNFE